MKNIRKGVMGIILFTLMLSSCDRDEPEQQIKGQSVYRFFDSTYLYQIPYKKGEFMTFKRSGKAGVDTVNILIEDIFQDTFISIDKNADLSVDTNYLINLVYQFRSDAQEVYFPGRLTLRLNNILIDRAFVLSCEIVNSLQNGYESEIYRLVNDTTINEIKYDSCIMISDSTIYSLDQGLVKFSLGKLYVSSQSQYYFF